MIFRLTTVQCGDESDHVAVLDGVLHGVVQLPIAVIDQNDDSGNAKKINIKK